MCNLLSSREQEAIAKTIVNFEDKFNRNFNYPYVFLNEVPFTDEFRSAIQQAAPTAKIQFGLIPEAHWSYPSWVDPALAAESRQQMDRQGVLYAGLESYHHMCRYQSGFFFDHPLLDE